MCQLHAVFNVALQLTKFQIPHIEVKFVQQYNFLLVAPFLKSWMIDTLLNCISAQLVLLEHSNQKISF